MFSWSTKRRLLYSGTLILLVAVSVAFIFFKFFYSAPTCSDGVKNGDESGIDCGGSCRNICTSDTLSPVVYWSKAFNISGDNYSVAAFVENPNTDSENLSAQ